MENNNFNKQGLGSESWRTLPVFIQASTILKLVEHLVEGIPAEDCGLDSAYALAMFDHHTASMMKNALLIPVKIAGAEGEDTIYDHKMENATVIRKAARELIIDSKGLQIAGFKDVDYLELLQREVEAFRPIFAEWIKTFNSSHYIIDRWGLFNPPGVDYNDLDTPEDLL